MERANLLLCPKTSTSTWRKLRSTPLTRSVKQTLLSTPLCVVQTQLKLSCSFTTWIQNLYSLFLYSQTAFIFLFWVYACCVSTSSVAFFPGVPVAGRFCSLCIRCLPVHRVLLQCRGCQKRGQHRSHLVCPDCSLWPVSWNHKVTYIYIYQTMQPFRFIIGSRMYFTYWIPDWCHQSMYRSWLYSFILFPWVQPPVELIAEDVKALYRVEH